MTGMEDFYIRKGSNEGLEVPLFTPDGQKTEHWLRIRGVGSDVFRLEEAESKRRAFELGAIEDEKERAVAIAEETLSLRAHLVMDWSFDKECTHENVMELFRNAPQIADAVDRQASKRALFLTKKSSSSDSTPKDGSDSKKSRKGQSKVSGQA